MILEEGKSLKGVKHAKASRLFTHYVDHYIETRTGKAVTQIDNTTHKDVRRIIQEWTKETIDSGDSSRELADYLTAEFEDMSDARAMLIARTEVGMASNNGSLGAAKSLQIPGLKKEWVTAEDDRVRPLPTGKGDEDHTAMDTEEVDVNEKFSVPPGDDMDCPGDGAAPAGQVCNCRCALVYNSPSGDDDGGENE